MSNSSQAQGNVCVDPLLSETTLRIPAQHMYTEYMEITSSLGAVLQVQAAEMSYSLLVWALDNVIDKVCVWVS